MTHRFRMRRAGGVLAAASLLAAGLPAATQATAAPGVLPMQTTDGPVFISEIHYDNASTDVGEAIEVQAPEGTDLSDWSLVLYNGSDGAAYNTTNLTGVVDDSGVVVATYPSNGIQNGESDGIALVNGTTVVEFLSYEGTLTAVGGPADGIASTDIGVEEGGSTPAGHSLQKIDGLWTGPAPASFGALNDGGGDPDPDPVEAFISEIHYDNVGTDAGEAIEVQAPAGSDLTGWTLVLYNGNGGETYGTLDLGIIDDSGVIVVEAPGLQNGPPDGVALVDAEGVVVEFLSYEGTFTAVGGPADGTTSTDIGVVETGDEPAGLSLQKIEGTWTGPSANSFGAVNSGGDTSPVDAFISEIHYDNAGTDADEKVEVEAPAGSDLTGWSVVLYNGNNGQAYDSLPLAPVGDSGVVVVDAAGMQNGSPDGLALVDADGNLVEFLSYEGAFTGAGGAADGVPSTDIGVQQDGSPVGHSLQKIDGTWTGPAPHSFGARNSGGDPEPPEEPTEQLISDVQGPGAVSPLDGQAVIVEGIVTSLFEDDDVLSGFFLQEEDADADSDAATSEGIFVFCGSACPAEGTLAEGHQVAVTGTVDEFFDMTQVNAAGTNGDITVSATGRPLPTAVPVDLPASGSTEAPDTFESTEGMVVTFPDRLVVSEYFELARFGQLILTVDERPYQFTHDNAPSVEGYQAHLADLATRRIILGSNNDDQNDATSGSEDNEPYPWPEGGLSIDNRVRGGDTINGLTGVLHWSFEAWRVRPIESVDYQFEAANPAPAEPEDVGGRLTVTSYNVLNYFATIDETSSNNTGPCGPSGTMDCRGADSEQERDRQLMKIANGLAEIDADVAGLIEIENDEGLATQQIVAALNDLQGDGTYAAIDTGFIGTDAIKVALIYQPGTVTPVGEFRLLDSTVDQRFLDDKNRPVLIQTFEENSTGERFTIAVNHLKSKGSSCDDVGDPDLNDGQANCNQTRVAAVQALMDYLATDPTKSGDPDFLIVGDLNAYAMEDPITTLETAGWTDLHEKFEGPEGYSYVFDGQLGYLDTALANEALLPQVTGTTAWHINADEVPLFDYNDDVLDAGEAEFERESTARPLYEPSPLRSSDHDPVIVGLDLASETQDPAQAVTELRGTLAAMPMSPLVKLVLDLELRVAQKAIEWNQPGLACGTLRAFDTTVWALSGRSIRPADAVVLREEATRIRGLLDC